MSTPATMTRSAYARYKGWDKAHVTRLAQAGRLVLTDDGKLVKVLESDRRIDESRDPNKEGVRERFADQRGETLARELAMAPRTAEDSKGGDAAPAMGAGGSPSAPTEQASLLDSRRELIAEQAKLAKLQREEREGRLVDRDQVAEAVFESYRMVRNDVLGLADRIATPIAAEINPAKVHDLLVGELRRLFDDLADRLSSGQLMPTQQ